MRDGIMEGQIDNRWNHSFGSWDIYDASGWDFTQIGLVNNLYLSEIRGLTLLNKWRSEGLSESEIQEKFIHDAILGSFASAPNVNQTIHKIRNEGLSYEDALILASNALYGKIISEAMNGKVLPPKGNKNSENHNIKEESVGKGTEENKPLDKAALEAQHGEGNVEQGGGNYKETKDKILEGQRENQKANESSNFGEHVKNEKEINAGKGTTGSSNNPVKPETNFAADANPNLNVNMNQQNKHIVGTNENNTANASSSIPRSTIDSNIDIQKLVNDYAGTGDVKGKIPLGQPGSKENISTNHVIGKYFDQNSNTFVPTTNFTIHYSKNGVHIVPARP